MSTFHRRAIARAVSDRLDEAPVVRVTGPRAAGKTTTCVAEIKRRGGRVIRLDDPDERRALQTDTKGYLSSLPRPILIDEYQRVPSTLDVIKLDLSSSAQPPGQWLLTGSISVEAVSDAAESLGGRLTDVTMGTLTVDERNDWPEPHFLARLLDEGSDFLRGWRSNNPLQRNELLAEAVRGGFPLITDRKSTPSRYRGFVDWINASVITDGAAVGGVRNVEGLRRMLRLYAAATACITPKDKPLAEHLEINRRTVANYRDLLASVHVTWDLPAFVPGNAAGQVTKSPKLHLIDSGLAAALAGRDQPQSLARDTAFSGALVETMVAHDLQVQCNAHETVPRLYHFREDSREVDLVVEGPDGRIFGIEIKLTSNPGNKDFEGLRRLRQSADSRWAGGLMLCRVPAGIATDDNLIAAPIEAIWQVTD